MFFKFHMCFYFYCTMSYNIYSIYSIECPKNELQPGQKKGLPESVAEITRQIDPLYRHVSKCPWRDRLWLILILGMTRWLYHPTKHPIANHIRLENCWFAVNWNVFNFSWNCFNGSSPRCAELWEFSGSFAVILFQE